MSVCRQSACAYWKALSKLCEDEQKKKKENEEKEEGKKFKVTFFRSDEQTPWLIERVFLFVPYSTSIEWEKV